MRDSDESLTRERPMTIEPAGLYVHIPFCLVRCGYCDFNAYEGLSHLSSRYVEALEAEAELVAPRWEGVDFVSVFLGGGTPTTLPPETIAALLGVFRDSFALGTEAEVTCEANPETVDEPYLKRLRLAGVNRLSFGVQSFDPEVLASLERLHKPESAIAAYTAARSAGFDDVNLDLIYGAETETLESWARTLGSTIALEPDHVSAYALTVEPDTPLGRQVAAGRRQPPDPDLQAAMYELACAELSRAGYEHYEISNWSLPGRRCAHNAGYWEGRPYLGLGAGAHSFRDGRRWWNVRPPERYLELVASGEVPVGGGERLSGEDQRLEQLLLGLRVSDGVPSGWISQDRVRRFVEEGLVEIEGGRLALTERGMLLANELVIELAG